MFFPHGEKRVRCRGTADRFFFTWHPFSSILSREKFIKMKYIFGLWREYDFDYDKFGAHILFDIRPWFSFQIFWNQQSELHWSPPVPCIPPATSSVLQQLKDRGATPIPTSPVSPTTPIYVSLKMHLPFRHMSLPSISFFLSRKS